MFRWAWRGMSLLNLSLPDSRAVENLKIPPQRYGIDTIRFLPRKRQVRKEAPMAAKRRRAMA